MVTKRTKGKPDKGLIKKGEKIVSTVQRTEDQLTRGELLPIKELTVEETKDAFRREAAMLAE